jgi:hypothetical protein
MLHNTGRNRGSSSFHLMKCMLSISNERSRFKVGTLNGVYEVNVNTSFKNLNNMKSCAQLNISTSSLNPNHKMERILYMEEPNLPLAFFLFQNRYMICISSKWCF